MSDIKNTIKECIKEVLNESINTEKDIIKNKIMSMTQSEINNYLYEKERKMWGNDRNEMLSFIRQMRKEHIKPVKVSSGKNVMEVDSDGILTINGVKIYYDRSSGAVKFGSPPKAALGMYPAGTFDDQLQGINNVFTVQRIIRLLLDGSTFQEVDKELSKSKYKDIYQTHIKKLFR